MDRETGDRRGEQGCPSTAMDSTRLKWRPIFAQGCIARQPWNDAIKACSGASEACQACQACQANDPKPQLPRGPNDALALKICNRQAAPAHPTSDVLIPRTRSRSPVSHAELAEFRNLNAELHSAARPANEGSIACVIGRCGSRLGGRTLGTDARDARCGAHLSWQVPSYNLLTQSSLAGVESAPP
jgi:hypothetical protein